jgi:hypothetical protein
MIGPYDLLSGGSLTTRAGVVLHGNTYSTDPINQMIPWTSLTWTQVHHGVLPLWNPSNGLGLPLAFNWQSAAFGLPSLVGYLVPLHYAYTAGVIVTLCIAGTGGYVLGRVLGLRVLGVLTIATIFELSGPLIAWLGYPQAQTMAWAPWLVAAGLLVVRGGRSVPSIAFFAVVTACAIYAGHPETLVVTMIATLLLVALILISRAMPSRFGLPGGAILRPAVDMIIAGVAGAALGAPLLLPGLQLTASSVRSSSPLGSQALPWHDTLYTLFLSFDGAPLPGNYPFGGGGFFFNETAVYVGVIALVLASMGILSGFMARRPEVLALVVVGAVMAATVYVTPVVHLINDLPFFRQVNWLRALMPLSLVLAVLAGFGIDAMSRTSDRRLVRLWPFGGFVAAAGGLGLLWLIGRDGGLPAFGESFARHVRAESFVWPAIGVAVGVIVCGLVLWQPRWRPAGTAFLLGGEVVLLIVAGSVQIASSANGYPPTRAVNVLQRKVGDARVGAGIKSGGACTLGINADANILFGVNEFDLYDPIVPHAYFTQWRRDTHTSAGSPNFDEFCPTLTTVAQARQFGVKYVLESAGSSPLAGGQIVATLSVPNPEPGNPLSRPPGNEVLYRVPHSSVATLSTRSGRATAVAVTDPTSNPGQIGLVTHSGTGGILQVRITNVPGWRATIDGRPLALTSSSVFELRARVPAGTHHIQLRYWPPLFSDGLGLAVLAAVTLGAMLAVDRRRQHRGKRPSLHEPEGSR